MRHLILKKDTVHPIILIILFLFPILLQGATINKIVSDDQSWDNPEGWDCNCVPTINDDVIIAGTVVFVDGLAEANSITVKNIDDFGTSKLIIYGGGLLHVLTDIDLLVTVPNSANVSLIVRQNGVLNVDGDLNHFRPINYIGSANLGLITEDIASVTIAGDFNMLHLNGISDDPYVELDIKDQSIINVLGNMNLRLDNFGSYLDLALSEDARLNVDGNLEILNQSYGRLNIDLTDSAIIDVLGDYNQLNEGVGPGAKTKVDLYDVSKIQVGGDMLFSSNAVLNETSLNVNHNGEVDAGSNIVFENLVANTVMLKFFDDSELKLHGFINRSNGTGSLLMEDNAMLALAGDLEQEIPAPFFGDEEYGGDLITLNSVKIANISGVRLEATHGNETSISTLNLELGELNLNGQSLRIMNPSEAAVQASNGGGIKIADFEQNLSSNSKALDRSSNSAFTTTIVWETGSNVAEFVLPLITESGLQIPITVQNEESVGDITFSTYATDPNLVLNNRPLPAGVDNFMLNGTEGADYSVDRFWNIETSVNSSTTDISFQYTDLDLANNPLLVESSMKLYKWNANTSEWEELESSSTDENSNLTSASNIDAQGTFAVATPSAVIPIELLKFDAAQMNKSIELSWTTATEINNSHFNLERSSKAKNWETIGQVNSKGESTNNQHYSFLDNRPLEGKNYYRLQQVDYNGKYSYSEVILIDNINNRTRTQIYPNPVRSGQKALMLEFNTELEHVSIKLLNNLGQQVLDYKIEHAQQIELDLSSLQTGIYYLQLQKNTGETELHQVLIN